MLPEQITFTMIDALSYHQKAGRFCIPTRRFSALSLRLRTEAKYCVGDKKKQLHPPALCLIPEGVAYERNGGDEEVLVIRFHMLNWSPKEILIFPIEDVTPLLSMFTEAVDVFQKKEAGYLFHLSSLLNRIFAAISTKETERLDQREYVSAAVSYIKQNLSDTSLSVARLAEEVGVSPAQLRRRFHQSTGISPKQYIDDQRAETARMLIETGFYSQAEIAERCGYADVDYFRTVFKKKNGVSIRGFKKKE